jgi:hypothetical protein
MPLFWKPYQSDVTRFIDELKAGQAGPRAHFVW